MADLLVRNIQIIPLYVEAMRTDLRDVLMRTRFSCRHSPEGVAYREQLTALANALVTVAKAPAGLATSMLAGQQQQQQQQGVGPGFLLLQLLDVLLPELAKMGKELEPRAAGDLLNPVVMLLC
jgi:hypothetical protein